MKKTLLYVGLIVFAGMLAGALVCGLVWMQTLYELSMSYYVFTVIFWLEMIATLLFGFCLRKYFKNISKIWVFSSVLMALLCCYLFPQFLTPKCSEIPTVKAGCTTTCVPACSRWVPLGHPECPGPPAHPWDEGCCLAYNGEKCTEVCVNDPPAVSGYTTCTEFGSNSWCTAGGELHMSGSDPDGDGITISGTMVGQSFTCAAGNSCLRTLIEGNGAAVFHSHDGELSSGNFSVGYKYDITPPTLSPTVSGTAGSNGWYTSPVSVSTGALDAVSGVGMAKIRLLSGDWQDSLDFSAEGTQTVEMSALDNAGNEATQQAQIMVDTVKPVIDVQVSGTPGINDWYRSDVSWQASATDVTSGMASIEVNLDGAGWAPGISAVFSTEGPHSVDFRFTDVAGNQEVFTKTFSIDKTNPTINITAPLEGAILSRVVTLTGTAEDPLSSLMDVSVTTNGGATWQPVPWAADGSWSYTWDTTQGPNGVFALMARSTDEAGNSTTQQVNVIVDNAPPSVSITQSWWIWETADAAVYEQVIPLGSISITVECGDLPDRTYDYNPNRGPFTYQWDRRCGDGQAAASGTYSVVLRACDIYDNCASARGKVEIPFVALSLPTSTPMATSTPMPTLQTPQAGAWYQNPTSAPSLTPTPQGTMVFPVLRTINEQEDGKDSSGTSDQPLLPLAAAALGTSVLLAAASRKEEKETLVGATAPTVKVSNLAALAGVVKTSFDGIWNEAVRISPADAPSVRVTTYYVGTEDPAEYLQRQVEMKANTATVVSTGSTSSAGKVLKKPSESKATTYQDYLYGTSSAKSVASTSNSGQKKTTSVGGAKSTTTSTSSAAKTSSSTKATTTTSSGGVLNWISNTAKSAVNTVKNVVTTVAASAKNAFDTAKNTVITAVSNIVGYGGIKAAKVDRKPDGPYDPTPTSEPVNEINNSIQKQVEFYWERSYDGIDVNGNKVYILDTDNVDKQEDVYRKLATQYGEGDNMEAYIIASGTPTATNPILYTIDLITTFLKVEQWLEENTEFRNLIYKVLNLPPDFTSNLYYKSAITGIRNDDYTLIKVDNLMVRNSFGESVEKVIVEYRFIDDNDHETLLRRDTITDIPSFCDLDILTEPFIAIIGHEYSSTEISVSMNIYTEGHVGEIHHVILK